MLPRKELVPIKEIPGHEINIARALDPYFLLELYGAHQLRDALAEQTTANLREAVALVKERNKGSQPRGRTAAAIIDYIVEHVVGTR
jgi:hypothetical protein